MNPNLPIGLPAAPSPASSNVFDATQGPGLWDVTIDETQQQFSYQALTYPGATAAPTNGTFLDIGGFLSLSSSGSAVGYGAEIPGRVAAIAPGDDTTAPVLAVEQDSCPAINGSVKFQFVAIPSELLGNVAQVGGATPGYGTIEAESSTDGKTWQFGAQAQYLLPYTLGSPGHGAPVQPGTVVGAAEQYLVTFPATCSVTNGQASISAAPNVSSITSASPLPTTFVVGPTGFYFEDQSTGKQTRVNADANLFIGAIQPAAPLTTSSIVTGKYMGFLHEAGLGNISVTQPIGFGQIVAGSGTSMTGGTYLNDDVTQFQNSNIVLNLGAQDSVNNGLYTQASLTFPDPQNVCFVDPATNKTGAGGTSGVDQYGNETCTFNAVAVVGVSDNKYAIFIASWDVFDNVAMGMYLFQQ